MLPLISTDQTALPRELIQESGGRNPRSSVVITTRNRIDELRNAIRSALTQTAPLEILVIDDGSTDGTAATVRAEFPSVRLEQSPTSKGYIAQRNRGARLAQGDIIFSIDDDAEFVSPNTVEQTLLEFDNPRIGAVAIPYIEPNSSPVVRQKAPIKDGIFVTDSYIGTAHAVRKDLFLKVGGYRESLIHQGEERDFCLRMMEAGYVVRLGNADPLHHWESPRRDFTRMDYYGRRNDILFAWQNVPRRYLAVHLFATSVNGFRSALKARRYLPMFRGTAAGWWSCLQGRVERKPVNIESYRLSRHLKKSGPQLIGEIDALMTSFSDGRGNGN